MDKYYSKNLDLCGIKQNETTSCHQRIKEHPFLKQVLIGSGLWTVYFMAGLSIGAPTVVIPQMRNESITITDEMASWISSTVYFGAYPWMILFPILMKVLGRKKTYLIISLTSVLAFTIFIFSNGKWTLTLSFALLSAVGNAGMSFLVVCLSEYISPENRGLFLVMKSASYQWGIWVSNALGTFFHWKSIGYLGLLCSIYTLAAFTWPESPYWLADKELYEKCSKSFISIRGLNETTNAELAELITSSRKKHLMKTQRRSQNKILSIFMDLGSKEILRPTLLSIVVISLFFLCGKAAYSMYAIDIIKSITKDTSTAYKGMLILDGITVAGMYIGSFLNKFINRRTMLLSFSVLGDVFLFILSGYMYLVQFGYLNENPVVILGFLGIFSLCISIGPMSLTSTLYGELIPLRNRSWCAMIISIYTVTLGAIIIKFCPYFFIHYGVRFVFLLFGCCTLVCNVILYFYLPETRDKTLHDIAKYFSDDNKFNENELNFAIA